MFEERPLNTMSSRVSKLSINPTYSASGRPNFFTHSMNSQTLESVNSSVSSQQYANVALVLDDKENVDPLGQGHHRDALLLSPAENIASSESKYLRQMIEAHYRLGMQIYPHLNALANSPQGGKPNPDPEPIPAKSRRRRYPLQDITAIIYPGQVDIHMSAGYGSNNPIYIPSSGHPPHQYASPRPKLAKRKAKQAAMSSKVKKHFGNPCLETGDKTEYAVPDSTSKEYEKKNTIKKVLQNNARVIRRRQLRRATNCTEIHKTKAEGCFPV